MGERIGSITRMATFVVNTIRMLTVATDSRSESIKLCQKYLQGFMKQTISEVIKLLRGSRVNFEVFPVIQTTNNSDYQWEHHILDVCGLPDLLLK